jgi:hypothetical protein
MNFATGQEKYIFIIKKLSSLFLFIFNDGTGGSSYPNTTTIAINVPADYGKAATK